MYAAFAAHERLLQAGGGGTTAGEHYYSYYIMCPHTTTCVLVPLHMCPHSAIYSSCKAGAGAAGGGGGSANTDAAARGRGAADAHDGSEEGIARIGRLHTGKLALPGQTYLLF